MSVTTVAPHFSYRWETITPDASWPTTPPPVRLHHPLALDLTVPSWDDGRLQLERLNALQSLGYCRRDQSHTDFRLLMHAKRVSSSSPKLLDHHFYFHLDHFAIILGHCYAPEDLVRTQLPAICQNLANAWHCDITCDVDQRFNLYWPTEGSGYEIRRPSRVRGPR